MNKIDSESDGFERIQDIPCLLIWGEKDNLIPFKPYYEKFKNKLPKASCRKIEGAGHAPFVEKTGSVYELIRTFMTHNI